MVVVSNIYIYIYIACLSSCVFGSAAAAGGKKKMQQNPTESLRRMPGEAIDGGRASPSSSASSSSASSSSSSSSGAEVLGEGGGGGGGGGSAKTTSSESSDVCRYFSRGMCRFGEMCRFAHILGENVWAANLCKLLLLFVYVKCVRINFSVFFFFTKYINL